MSNFDSSVDMIAVLERAADQADEDRTVGFYYEMRKQGVSETGGCLHLLASQYNTRCLLSWFRDRDLAEAKKNAFIGCKLLRMRHQIKPLEGAMANDLTLIYPLISDHVDVMHWQAQYMQPLFVASQSQLYCENPNSFEFMGLLAKLALQQQWELLEHFCNKLINNPPKKHKTWVIDCNFYLALARGDRTGMESAIGELTEGRYARQRRTEFGLTREGEFFSAYGFMYSKMAWREGYQTDVDSQWIPREWLPVEPLEEYPEPYDFLREFDLFRPLDEFSDNELASREFSPRPPGEPILTFPEMRSRVEVKGQKLWVKKED